MDTFEIVVYIVLPVLIALLIIITLLLKKKPEKKVIASEETLNDIYVAFGKKENIINIKRTQDRINFTVKDVKSINNNTLRDLNIAAFLKKNEVTILFKNGSKNLYEYVKTKLKE